MPQHRRLSPFLALLLLAGCAAAPAGRDPVSGSEPANLGVLKRELVAYHDGGAYERDIAAMASRAAAWIEERAGKVARPALVLDIDETSISNWPQMRVNDFGYFKSGPCDLEKGPCGALAWEDMGRGEPIRPVLDLYRKARALGVAVFFVTGRQEAQRAGTERNLRAAGYEGWEGVVLRPEGPRQPTAEYKSGARAAIEAKGYTIVANVGDQDTDLAGGHAEKGFKLPNPFYWIP